MKTIRDVQQALLTTIATISLLVCCTKTDTELPERTKEDFEDLSHLTIRQSRLFFEEFTAGHAAKTKSADDNTDRLVIGEFIPNWDNTEISWRWHILTQKPYTRHREIWHHFSRVTKEAILQISKTSSLL